jgi:hypothetical protein
VWSFLSAGGDLCYVLFIYPVLFLFWCQKIEASSTVWTLPNGILSKDGDKSPVSETWLLYKNRKMNIVQKVNNCVQPIA